MELSEKIKQAVTDRVFTIKGLEALIYGLTIPKPIDIHVQDLTHEDLIFVNETYEAYFQASGFIRNIEADLEQKDKPSGEFIAYVFPMGKLTFHVKSEL